MFMNKYNLLRYQLLFISQVLLGTMNPFDSNMTYLNKSLKTYLCRTMIIKHLKIVNFYYFVLE